VTFTYGRPAEKAGTWKKQRNDPLAGWCRQLPADTLTDPDERNSRLCRSRHSPASGSPVRVLLPEGD